jgi:DNA replication protein DnaC
MSTLTVGKCACGVDVEREQAEGFGAHILNALPFLCSACSARKESEWADQDRLEAEAAEALRLGEKLESLPAALRRVRVDELDIEGREGALDAARRWAGRDLKGLVLLGDIGVGKTTIAAGAFTAYTGYNLDRPTPRWINTVQALNDLSRGFNDPHRISTMDALDGKHAALVLDDIDKAKPNASAAAHLFGAIDACMTHERPLIVTTNLMPSQLAAYWPKPHGATIASRLAGYCEMHRVSGRDRRLGGGSM